MPNLRTRVGLEIAKRTPSYGALARMPEHVLSDLDARIARLEAHLETCARRRYSREDDGADEAETPRFVPSSSALLLLTQETFSDAVEAASLMLVLFHDPEIEVRVYGAHGFDRAPDAACSVPFLHSLLVEACSLL